jgi:hypothetical protein
MLLLLSPQQELCRGRMLARITIKPLRNGIPSTAHPKMIIESYAELHNDCILGIIIFCFAPQSHPPPPGGRAWLL